ncbi:MAG: glycosyl hydrolase [Candidatus Hydrogenedentota bacterium]|uniref:1,4-alpha-glucan branching enzyme n=1 Tax=Sumerlaea chitinivorans TaxID=2250252 RepID=A0A2Z4Y6Z0_SUMC1|nr:Malto-oligosyltrehalose trehalohydrolase [Candidatus Sumerlaea chitinivorans]RMH29238.1 MAG: glycosyl hydrolase [Candidatus Hydrogenedentota bacterium]GIX45002.1 MAG: 1,4-alpha-glucan branching enzyme [Candidatus Sumerlaea sp.]
MRFSRCTAAAIAATVCWFTAVGDAATIFSDSFNSSTLGPQWSRSGTGTWRVQTSTTYRYGSSGYGVTLDDSVGDSAYATSRLDLKLNLATVTNVVLTFKFRNVGDEAHSSDGLYLSTDGGLTYKKITTWSFPAISSSFSVQTVNISNAASSLGLVLGPNTIIRWQEYDNYPLSSDGVAIDDVVVTADTVPSTRGGVGAIPYTNGTTFRVWAPNASAVAVAGTFNNWDGSTNKLASEGNGWWSVDFNKAIIGDQYKFVITHPSYGTFWRQDPQARQMTNDAGNSIIVDPGYSWGSYSYSTPAWNDTVIYEMHVGTFNDSPGGGPGNFASVTAKMDYLQSLGVNMLLLMPCTEFPGDFSWGYNPHSQFAPESAYGSVQALKALVDAAHARGIGVMMDIVFNHMGSSPYESSIPLWNFDGESYGNGGIYFFSDWRKVTPWGWSRPDYGRGEVRSFLKDAAMMWLNDYRMDGLRWDSTCNIRALNNGGGGDIPEGWSLMQWINNTIDSSASWKLSIAEDMQNNDWLTKPTSSGGAGFDSQWDPSFVHPIRSTVITSNDADRNMYTVRDAITHYYNGWHLQRVIYTESHDEVANGHSRLPEEIWPGNAGSWYSKKRSTLAAGILFTAPGIPMIFQGQEFLEDGYFSDGDPLDWSKTTTYAGILQLYKDLIKLRRNWYNNTRGLRGNNVNVYHINNTDKVIAYHRWDQGGPGDDVVVVANFANRAYTSYNIGMPRGGTWYVRFNSDWNGYSSDFGNWNSYNTTANSGAKDGMNYNANVGIGPYTVIILSQ